MQTLYLNIEDRVRIKRKAVVFGQKLCKIVFIEALYLVDPALNIDIFGIVEKADEFFGLCQVIVALKQLPAQTFGILMSMEPVLAALSGIIFLGEQLNVAQWVALACIIVASIGATLTIRRKA